MTKRIKDLTGQRFGMLTVLKLDHVAKIGGKYRTFWLCQCECGNQKVLRGDTFRSGTGRPVTVSCGCYVRNRKSPAYIDDRSKTKLYHVYYGILQRCNNPNSSHYSYYGERGIKCLFRDWDEFRDWSLSHGYEHGLTIDRIDNNGNYEPSNCRWVPMSVNHENRRKSSAYLRLFLDGKEYSLAEICRMVNQPYMKMYSLMRNNWDKFVQSVTTMAHASTLTIDTCGEAGETRKR